MPVLNLDKFNQTVIWNHNGYDLDVTFRHICNDGLPEIIKVEDNDSDDGSGLYPGIEKDIEFDMTYWVGKGGDTDDL